jgi:hypothetical protein
MIRSESRIRYSLPTAVSNHVLQMQQGEQNVLQRRLKSVQPLPPTPRCLQWCSGEAQLRLERDCSWGTPEFSGSWRVAVMSFGQAGP